LGRDRDLFDRTIGALRRRLVEAGPLQGRPLAINALAVEFDVSQTPVREALAHLADEGLVVRTATSYVGRVYDTVRLAQLYILSRDLLILALSRARDPRVDRVGPTGERATELLSRIAVGGGEVLAEAFGRAQSELAPFQPAEQSVLGARETELAPFTSSLTAGDVGAIARAVRRHYDRRAARSREILAAALMGEV
jgi:hypothetical protein